MAAYAWFVTRQEIDYRGNVGEGAIVTAVTEIRDPPRGARFNRYYSFTDAAGKVLVEAKTSWAMVNRATSRVMRILAAVAAPYALEGGWTS